MGANIPLSVVTVRGCNAHEAVCARTIASRYSPANEQRQRDFALRASSRVRQKDGRNNARTVSREFLEERHVK